jgi:hypothetical protein
MSKTAIKPYYSVSKGLSIKWIGILVILSLTALSSFAQQSNLDLQVTIKAYDDSMVITAKAINGQPPYQYYLLDNPISEEGKVIEQSAQVSDIFFEFDNLKIGTYSVCVLDKTKYTRCETVGYKKK